jgi:hypothetical protein
MARLLMTPQVMNMTTDPTPIVRWEFQRGDRHLTCRVDAVTDIAEYDVATVPHWDLNAAFIETFDAAGAALRRHADIAAHLREAGWTVASYTA